jgi:biotin synthase
LLDKWRSALPHIPVSILSNPTTLQYGDLKRMKAMGADIFTVALDAATPAIFERTRGKTVASPHTWKKYWQVIEWAAEIFGPEKCGAHLICGLGETEYDILNICQQIRDFGGHNHMFAFFPERGSMMEDWAPVDRAQWRRVQLARFIIDYAGGHITGMRFNTQGQVVHYGLDHKELEGLIRSGTPFRTSGCPARGGETVSACNRPFGDSTPGDIYSFPFALDEGDVAVVQRQLHGEDVASYETESLTTEITEDTEFL